MGLAKAHPLLRFVGATAKRLTRPAPGPDQATAGCVDISPATVYHIGSLAEGAGWEACPAVPDVRTGWKTCPHGPGPEQAEKLVPHGRQPGRLWIGLIAELSVSRKHKTVYAILAVLIALVFAAGLLRPRPAPVEARPQATPAGGSAVKGPAATPAGNPSGGPTAAPAGDTGGGPTATPAGDPGGAPADTGVRETRAVWVSRFDLKDAGSVQAVVDKVAYAHMNTILFQVRGAADAVYSSSLEPRAAGVNQALGQDPSYDPLADLIAKAHAKGIQVQAWMNVYPVWQGDTPPPENLTPTPMYYDFHNRYGDEWLQWSGGQPMQLGGEGYLAANPAHPAVQDRVVDVAKDLLSRYELDGLHLDYVRYSGPEYSDDPLSNRLYSEAAAQNPGLSRADWQREQVTSLVRRVRDEALPLRPGAVFTTSAWAIYKDNRGWFKGRDGYNGYYQDSQGWASGGLVSAIMPMIYGTTLHDHLDRYQTLAQDYVAGSQPGRVVLGVGADYDSFADIAARIDVTRQVGARGQALFSYGALDQHNYWQALRDGPYQEPAAPDWG